MACSAHVGRSLKIGISFFLEDRRMHKKSWKVLQICLVAFIAIGSLWFGVTQQAEAADLQQTPKLFVTYDKTAAPNEVDAGGVVTVSLWVQATGNCSAKNSPVDVLLVLDRSGHMSGQSMTDAKLAAISFVNQMDLTVDQVGVTSFASTNAGKLDHALSQNADLWTSRDQTLCQRYDKCQGRSGTGGSGVGRSQQRIGQCTGDCGSVRWISQ